MCSLASRRLLRHPKWADTDAKSADLADNTEGSGWARDWTVDSGKTAGGSGGEECLVGMHAVVYLEAEGADAQGCLSRSLDNLAGGLAVPTQGRAFAGVTNIGQE